MNTFKIMLMRELTQGLAQMAVEMTVSHQEKCKRAFLSCAEIMTNVGFITFDGWETETHDNARFIVAKFRCGDASHSVAAAPFLRGVAHAVSQLS